MNSTNREISRVPPHWMVRALGAVIAIVDVAVVLLLITDPEVPRLVALLVGLICLAVTAVGVHLAMTPAVFSTTPTEVIVSYWPWTLRVARSDIQDIKTTDAVDGIGFGYGYRWEGRGRRAVRVGGPVVTIIHREGRVGVSVDDPRRVAEELRV